MVKKHLKIFFSRIEKASRPNLGIKYLGLKVYQVCSNDYPRLTFDLLKANLHPYAFVWENSVSQNVLKTNG